MILIMNCIGGLIIVWLVIMNYVTLSALWIFLQGVICHLLITCMIGEECLCASVFQCCLIYNTPCWLWENYCMSIIWMVLVINTFRVFYYTVLICCLCLLMPDLLSSIQFQFHIWRNDLICNISSNGVSVWMKQLLIKLKFLFDFGVSPRLGTTVSINT